MKTKTGEVFFRDEAGALFKATSYEEDGVVTTENELVEPAPEAQEPSEDEAQTGE